MGAASFIAARLADPQGRQEALVARKHAGVALAARIGDLIPSRLGA